MTRKMDDRLAYGGTPHEPNARAAGKSTRWVNLDGVQYQVDLENGAAVRIVETVSKSEGGRGVLLWTFGSEKTARILKIIFQAENAGG